MNKKLLILGYALSGKDELAEILSREYGYQYKTTSLAVAEVITYPILKESQGYSSAQECYEDRRRHRPLLKNLIAEYNDEDKARLAKEVLKTNDIYVGMRCKEEVQACIDQGVFDKVIWVDRNGAYESSDSCTVDSSMARYVVTNNGSLEDLRNVGAAFVHHIMTDDSLTGFVTNNSDHYGEFLSSSSWNEGNSKPKLAGTYKVIAHDIVSSWFETAYYDGKYWLTGEGQGQFPCLIDKWVEEG